MQQFSSHVAIIVEACQKVSNRLRRDFGEIENLQNTPSGASSFVKKAMERTQSELVKIFQTARPKYSFFIGGEKIIQGADISHSFYIEPISGILSFLHGISGFKIFVGIQEQKDLITGVIYDPMNDSSFIAEKGKGAFLYSPYRSQRFRVSRREANFFLGTNTINSEEFTHKNDCVGDLIVGACSGKYDAVVVDKLTETEEKVAKIFIAEAGGRFEKINNKVILSSLKALVKIKNAIV